MGRDSISRESGSWKIVSPIGFKGQKTIGLDITSLVDRVLILLYHDRRVAISITLVIIGHFDQLNLFVQTVAVLLL